MAEPSGPTLAEELAAFAAKTMAGSLPDDVTTSVRQRVLDVLGLCVAAADLPTSKAALEHVAEQGGRVHGSEEQDESHELAHEMPAGHGCSPYVPVRRREHKRNSAVNLP